MQQRETCHRAAWGKRCVPPPGPDPWWGDSPPCSSSTTPAVSGHKGWKVLPGQSYWELWGSKMSWSWLGAAKTFQVRWWGTLTLRLLGLFILQDGQRQTWVESTELVGEQGQEASAEIWGKSDMFKSRRFLTRVWRLQSLTCPKGGQPLALVWSFTRVQLLQHHAGVLSCQVILNTHKNQTSDTGTNQRPIQTVQDLQGSALSRLDYNLLSSRTWKDDKR